MSIKDLSIKELAKEDKREVLSDCLQRIKEVEPKLHAFVTTLSPDDVEKDSRLRGNDKKGGDDSPLNGIPVGIKDVICTRNMRTTASAKMLDNFIPPYDATVVKKLRNAGVIIVGKNNCDAWAHGASTENSDYGVTPNPWDLKRVSGGSSGGSAAAVAAGEIPYSIGTDTGGSIRQPASFCGVVGLKPTYEAISRYGLIAMASSLDVIGPITRTVGDARIVLETIQGPDKKDATAILDLTDIKLPGGTDIKGKKIGVPKEYFKLGMDKEVEKVFNNACKVYEDLGAEIVDISLPHTDYGVATYYIIQTAEVSSNLGRYDGIKYGFSAKDSKDLIDSYFKTRDEGFGDEAKRRIMLGTYVLSSGYYEAYYLKAAKVRRLIYDDFEKVLTGDKRVDFILSPVSPTPAFKIGEKSDPVSMYLSDVFTVQANLAGIPAVSVPAGFSKDKLPIGIQLMGWKCHDFFLLDYAEQFEKATEGEEWRKFKTII